MTRYRFLLVDDFPELLEPMRYYFEGRGVQVNTAIGAADAITQAPSVDAIFMDTIMRPGIIGYEACRRIRNEPYGGGVVIIGASGRDRYSFGDGFGINLRKAWLAAGADGFVNKSAVMCAQGFDDLDKLVERCLRARGH